MNDPVLDMLDRLRLRPAMYIGRHSAEALFLYLVGYKTAVRDQTTADIAQYDAFIDSLYAKYGRGGGGDSWARVLGHVAGSDELGLELFFAELAAFRPVVDPGNAESSGDSRVTMNEFKRGDMVEIDGVLAVVVGLPGDPNVPEDHVALWHGEPRCKSKSNGGAGGAIPEVWLIPSEYVQPSNPPVYRH